LPAFADVKRADLESPWTQIEPGVGLYARRQARDERLERRIKIRGPRGLLSRLRQIHPADTCQELAKDALPKEISSYVPFGLTSNNELIVRKAAAA
jgi:hypothetical protein